MPDYKVGDIVLTPLNQRAILTELREDQRWDAWYIDDDDNKIAHASVVLNPKMICLDG